MVEEVKLTKLDLFDVRNNATRVMERYQHLGEMAAQIYQASEGGGDQDELKCLIEKMGHEHAKCGADLKAIRRTVM